MTEGTAWLPLARRAVFDAYRRDATAEWVEAKGQSMRPLIRAGAWMLVEFGVRPERIGEIVLFPREDVLVAHRVVATRRRAGTTLFVTKGDGEPYRETPLEPDAVMGVVRALRLASQSRPVTVGCGGGSGRVIAWISNVSGRAAALAIRGARHLPDPARRPAVAVPTALSRVASRAGAFPFALLAQLQSSRARGGEHGETLRGS